MKIQPDTDLTPFIGPRIVIDHVRAARIVNIRHCGDSLLPELRGGVGGYCIEDPHGGCRGGNTAFWWPYGTDLAVEATA